MKVYFVRHGESEYNIEKLWQHRKVPLSENGKKQAEFLAKRFTKIPVDVIISSPHCRSRGTAEIISRKLKKKAIFSELVGERKMPEESIGKYAYSKEVRKIEKAMRQNAKNPKWHYSNEESFAEFKGRIRKFFGYLNKLKEDNVLVVSHGGPIRLTILFMILGDDFEPEIYYKFIDVFRMTNTGITMCERQENGHWNLWAFNDHAHLG
ncbi:MAG: Phosphoglycerate mutase [Parcubacteria group bacterium GW2011_GWF2_43_11]|nr:MAG: Phosphoglycerate mutase [Parcubacteria group bacterium GW2011_GWB1_41_4]KKS90016.1 MAG: Phosphoglycerate mutase [Parcubacteria group bacterium GW2011_GWF2_43_11]